MHTQSSLIDALTALVLLVTTVAPATAGTTSWRNSIGGDIRMISAGGPLNEAGNFSAGLHLVLKKGWKTYWRFPGDSGIPLSVDFAGSINLASAELTFPAPERHYDGYSTSIGYKGDVVLPLTIRPQDPSKPVLINAKVRYGVCEAVCVPLEDDLSLIMSPNSPPDEASSGLIARARARVPVAASAGDPLSIVAVSIDDNKPRTFTFSAKLNAPSQPADLFVEGPEGSYLTVPTPLAVDGINASWTLPLDGLIYEGDQVTLRLTLINGLAAADQTWTFAASDLD